MKFHFIMPIVPVKFAIKAASQLKDGTAKLWISDHKGKDYHGNARLFLQPTAFWAMNVYYQKIRFLLLTFFVTRKRKSIEISGVKKKNAKKIGHTVAWLVKLVRLFSEGWKPPPSGEQHLPSASPWQRK